MDGGADVDVDEDDFLVLDEDDELRAQRISAAGEGTSDEGPSLRDFSKMQLKEDHVQRPMWVCPDGRIILETYSPLYKHAYDFLIAIAEPVCRPENVHEYNLTPHSLYAAVSVGLDTNTIISVLDRLSKTKLSADIIAFIRDSTQNYGKVKLVLQRNKYFVESPYPNVLRELLRDDVIRRARIMPPVNQGAGEAFAVQQGGAADGSAAALTHALMGAGEGDEGDVGGGGDDGEFHSFEIDPSQVERVKQRCLPNALNYPMLEEYDFRNDSVNPDVDVELKPHAQLRPYQEKSLSKMFGNGRARSGIIVLPCGAGKSLVGVSAAVRIRKSCLCLATNAVSVDQWCLQFKMWSTIKDQHISRFTSDTKEMFQGDAGIVVTTFNMIAFGGKRSAESNKIIEAIRSREWGLLLMDEVHVVPAQMFRKVIGITKSHCKLGLTATLVREDELIADLNFLIGPKLYEANWLDLVRGGYIANVQCVEVWCPMTREFYAEYIRADARKRQGLYVMNPNKFRACEYLIRFHEEQRRDKIIVFSDNLFALEQYARKLNKPMIYGPTSHAERTRVLYAFKNSPNVNTVFLSKVGDNSIDIPEANVIIQISSHAGSRRQEAQRLGRILRAKGRKEDRMAGGTEHYNAFFYSLVSTDTQEMYYSSKRQQFLIDQGYSFKVVTSLPPPGEGDDLCYTSKQEQLDLLSTVLSAGDEALREEVLAEDYDDLSHVPTIVRRTAASMSAMSGAQGRMYMEYSTGRGGGAGGRGGGAGRGAKPKDPAKRHSLFKQRYR
ncbi:hypothetical protein CLOM_g18048 [Closterium sp. NIES-68]|nr:hypothetical protein CLOM_g18048 [Closterium sp. NIES-68]GJP78667.1 hypothetical protein CLOP_g8939 [Closterium sp. NIES-67]